MSLLRFIDMSLLEQCAGLFCSCWSVALEGSGLCFSTICKSPVEALVGLFWSNGRVSFGFFWSLAVEGSGLCVSAIFKSLLEALVGLFYSCCSVWSASVERLIWFCAHTQSRCFSVRA